MAVELNCQSCGTRLRVADEFAGKEARCPKCSALTPIPFATVPAKEQENWVFGDNLGKPSPAAADSVFGNPYASPQPIQQSVVTYDGSAIHNVPVSADAVFGHAWNVWKANLGLLVLVTFVAALLNGGISFILSIVQEVMVQQDAREALVAVAVVGNVIANVVQLYLTAGQSLIALKLCRGQRADFGDLFGAGGLLLPLIGFTILFGLGVGLGLLLLIIPGILLMLMWWPAYYLILERRAGVIESFSLAAEIAKQNWGTTFVLWIYSVLAIILGYLALCIGVLFAAPLVTVMWAAAYLMMSGQLSPYSYSNRRQQDTVRFS